MIHPLHASYSAGESKKNQIKMKMTKTWLSMRSPWLRSMQKLDLVSELNIDAAIQ